MSKRPTRTRRRGSVTAQALIAICCLSLAVLLAGVAFASSGGDEENQGALSPTALAIPAYPETNLTLPLPGLFPQRKFELYGGIMVPIPQGWRITALDSYGLTMSKGSTTIRIASIKNSKATAAQQFSNSYPSGGAYSLVFDENHPRIYKVNDRRAEGLFTFQPGNGRDPRLAYAYYQVFKGGRNGFWYEATMPVDADPADLRDAMMILHAIEVPAF